MCRLFLRHPDLISCCVLVNKMIKWNLSLIFKRVNQMLIGYYNRYDITDNAYIKNTANSL